MNLKGRELWVLLMGILVVGLVFTIWDFRVWRHLETDRFGQGWVDLKPQMVCLDNYWGISDREACGNID